MYPSGLWLHGIRITPPRDPPPPPRVNSRERNHGGLHPSKTHVEPRTVQEPRKIFKSDFLRLCMADPRLGPALALPARNRGERRRRGKLITREILIVSHKVHRVYGPLCIVPDVLRGRVEADIGPDGLRAPVAGGESIQKTPPTADPSALASEPAEVGTKNPTERAGAVAAPQEPPKPVQRSGIGSSAGRGVDGRGPGAGG